MTAPRDLRNELGAAPITRDVLLVFGPEAAAFLQGQLSQDVESLAIGASAPSLLLQPTGKVGAWVRVTRLADDRFALDLDAGFGEAAATQLRRFRLRTKVDIDVETWPGVAVRGPGAAAVAPPVGAQALPVAWPGVEGVDVLGPSPVGDLGLPAVAPEELEALRVEVGVPAMGAELIDSTIPAEAGQWLVDASVSFTKGCYTGQELVARIDSRGGNVPRPLRGLLIDGDPVPVGAEVVPEGGGPEPSVVGRVTSSARSPVLGAIALATVGRSVGPGTRVRLVWDGGQAEATVAELPLR